MPVSKQDLATLGSIAEELADVNENFLNITPIVNAIDTVLANPSSIPDFKNYLNSRIRQPLYTMYEADLNDLAPDTVNIVKDSLFRVLIALAMYYPFNAVEDLEDEPGMELPVCAASQELLEKDNRLYLASGHLLDKQAYSNRDVILHPVLQDRVLDSRELAFNQYWTYHARDNLDESERMAIGEGAQSLLKWGITGGLTFVSAVLLATGVIPLAAAPVLAVTESVVLVGATAYLSYVAAQFGVTEMNYIMTDARERQAELENPWYQTHCFLYDLAKARDIAATQNQDPLQNNLHAPLIQGSDGFPRSESYQDIQLAMREHNPRSMSHAVEEIRIDIRDDVSDVEGPDHGVKMQWPDSDLWKSDKKKELSEPLLKGEDQNNDPQHRV